MNSDLLIAVALFLLGRGGKKAQPAVTFVPAPGTAAVPAATPPKPADVPWPSGIPKMAPPVPGQPLAFPPEIPWAAMPLPHSAEYAEYGPADPAHAPQARMRTGPVRAERQDATHALMARELQPFRRSYWRPKTRGLTRSHIETAKSLLKEWKPNGYRFSGPRTWAGRVQYRMTQHGGKKAVEVWEPAPPFV